MATLYWVGGSGSKSWSDTANWSTSAGGAGGSGPPGSADVVNIGVTASASDIDSNLTWTTGGGTLNVYPGFTGTIGTSGGTALDLNSSAVNYYGSASLANFADSGAILVSTRADGMVTFSAHDYTDTNITVVAGNVTFTSTATDIGDGTGIVEFHGGSVTIESATGAAATFSQWGGSRVQCARALGTVSTTGSGTQLRTTGTGAASRVNVAEHATYIINSTGTISALYNRPRGRITTAGIAGPVTVSAYYQYPGSKQDFADGITTVSADTIFDSPTNPNQ